MKNVGQHSILVLRAVSQSKAVCDGVMVWTMTPRQAVVGQDSCLVPLPTRVMQGTKE